MAHQATSLLGGKKIGITFTDKPVTPWGGLTLFSGLARQIGLEQALRQALPFRLTSPNATDPVEIVLAFMAGVLTGSRRLAHVERLRWDEGVRQILGLNRFVSDTTLARFLRRFASGTVTQVFEQLMRWQLGLIALNEDILDLDSSIMERYGKQEGAILGYNPATEAAFRLACVTYNLISLLQEKMGQKGYQTLGTLRAQLLTCGAVVGRDGNKTVLRLSLAGPWRDRFERALNAFFPSVQADCAAVGAG